MLASTFLEFNGHVERSASRSRAAHPTKCGRCNCLEGYVGRRFRYKEKALIKAVEMAFVCLDAAFDCCLSMYRRKILGWHDDLLACKTTVYCGQDIGRRCFILSLKFSFISFVVELLICYIQIKLY